MSMPDLDGREAVSSTALQCSIDTLLTMSSDDRALLDVGYQVDTIGAYAHAIPEVGAVATRAALQAVLAAKTPWSEVVAKIDNELAGVAYSTGDQELLRAEQQSALGREAVIAQEIAGGADPWLTRVRHNERDIRNPFVVGFYQDTDGKIRPLYGPRYFQSLRQIKNTVFGGRNENKQISLLEGAFTQVHPKQILRSSYWNLLPADLRQHLDNGEILTTTPNDVYDFSNADLYGLASSQASPANVDLIDRKQKQAAQTTDYFLLFTGDHGGTDGRTGVVMRSENGTVQPLIIAIDGREYVVEAKGCGARTGGFSGMQIRTNRRIVEGGAEAEQAIGEFQQLELETQEDGPKALGSVVFDNPNLRIYDGPSNRMRDYPQGYILRLTPSTVRASYTGIDAFPRISGREFVMRVIDMYAGQLVEHIFGVNPKLLDRSSHTENIMLWGDGRRTFTDYSDHVSFGDTAYPQEDNLNSGYMTPRTMLGYYLSMLKEIPGYDESRDRRHFMGRLSGYLQKAGCVVDVDIADTDEQIIERVWHGGMAERIYEARKAAHYWPETLHREAMRLQAGSFLSEKVGLGDRADFVSRAHTARQKLLTVVDTYAERVDVAHLKGLDMADIKARMVTSTFGDQISIASELSRLRYDNAVYDSLGDDETRKVISDTLGYFSAFHAFFAPLEVYFQHERDVLVGAMSTCVDRHRYTELHEALQDINNRESYLRLLVNDYPDAFHEFITNASRVRDLLTLNVYQ